MSTLSNFLPRQARTGDIITTMEVLDSPEYLPCDGGIYLKSSYPELFGTIGQLPEIKKWRTIASTSVTTDESMFAPTTSHITKGNGDVFVCRGTSPHGIYRSTDLSNWTIISTAPLPNGTIVSDGINTFIGSLGKTFVYSTDNGLTWGQTGNISSNGIIPNGYAYGDGLWLAYSYTIYSYGKHLVYTSTDPTNASSWNSYTVNFGSRDLIYNDTRLKYLNGYWILFGRIRNNSSLYIHYSTNPTTDNWDDTRVYHLDNGFPVCMGYANGVYVFGYHAGGQFYINSKSSLDSNGTTTLIGDVGSAVGIDLEFNTNDSHWYLIFNQRVYRSQNTTSWTLVHEVSDMSVPNSPLSYQYYNGSHYALGSGTLEKSSNGVDWYIERRRTPLFNSGFHVADNTVVRTASSGEIIYKENLNDSESERKFIGGPSSLYTVTKGPLWVAAGQNGAMMSATTPSGNWTPRTSGSTKDINDIQYAASLYVAVGDGGYIGTSTNGTTWTVRSSGTTLNITKVKYRNGIWIAQAGNRLIRSTNGTTWSLLPTPVPYSSVMDFEGGNGKWIFIGDTVTSASSTEDFISYKSISGFSGDIIIYNNDTWISSNRQDISSAGQQISISKNGNSWKHFINPQYNITLASDGGDGGIYAALDLASHVYINDYDWDTATSFKVPFIPAATEDGVVSDIVYIKT